MPIYDFYCRKCSDKVVVICSMRERNEPRTHIECGGDLEREEIPSATGRPHFAFEPGVVMGSGEEVKGTFGPPALPPKRTSVKDIP